MGVLKKMPSENKTTISIKDIIINGRYRKEFGDIDTLADNISQLGLFNQ